MPGKRKLTDLEKELLAIVWKDQPCTLYWVKKVFESSPVGARRDSAGSVYPALNRLVKSAHLKKKAIRGDGRGTSEVTCTPTGVKEIRKWMFEISALQTFPVDPLRTRTFFLGALTKKERLEWLKQARSICDEQLARIDDFEKMTHEKSNEYAVLGGKIAKDTIRSKRKVIDKFLGEKL